MSRIEEALKKVASNRAEPDLKTAGAGLSVDKLSSERRQRSKKRDAADLLTVEPIQINNLLLPAAKDERTEVVEEYNKLRSSVIALTKGETFHNTLMVTSTVSEEGKTMTSINLALSLAKEFDHTVLLVDTDLRRPSIHRFLGLEPEFGLIHCLKDNLSIDKALIKTGLGKLVVLPAGGAVDDPVDLLSSNRMKEIIQELKNRYSERYVIFDTPPSMPFADAGILSANVDKTLFVVREGRADKKDVRRKIEDFKEHNLLGVIYNDAHMFLKKHDYSYY